MDCIGFYQEFSRDLSEKAAMFLACSDASSSAGLMNDHFDAMYMIWI